MCGMSIVIAKGGHFVHPKFSSKLVERKGGRERGGEDMHGLALLKGRHMTWDDLAQTLFHAAGVGVTAWSFPVSAQLFFNFPTNSSSQVSQRPFSLPIVAPQSIPSENSLTPIHFNCCNISFPLRCLPFAP